LDERHVPALDGVRGLAILLVLLYHHVNSLQALGLDTPLFKPFQLGWCGVDLFFALSGFLITGILLDAKGSSNFFGSFYARRVLRIFPLYYLALALVFLSRAVLPEAGVWGDHGEPFAPGSLLWPALFLENAATLEAGRGPTGIVTHYWSLAVEEHFYLVWPALVWLARTRRQVLLLALGAAALSIAARAAVWMQGVDLNHVFGLTPLRLDGLAFGAAAAVLVRERPVATLLRPAAVVLALCASLFAAIVLVRFTPDQGDPALWIFAYPLVSLGASAALVLCLAGGRLAGLLSVGPLRWLGKYSFGLYVWHPIVGVLLMHSTVAIVPQGGPAGPILLGALFVLVLDLVVAWLSFHLWETRFLALKRFFPVGAGAPGALPAPPLSSADAAVPARTGP
jgi:peptidoglycan/LPS O-acetylase OafA/YrhL